MRLPLHLPLLLTALAFAGPAVPAEAVAERSSAPLLAPRPVQNWLPDLGSTANASLSRTEEFQVGRMMVRDLRQQNALFDDAETSDYLQSLGSRIGVEAQQGEQRLTFFAIRDRSLNAFALPGGFIGVHTGLILRTDTEAELAGVVAHEIGHVVQRHIARAVEAQGRINMTALAGLLGAVLVGATGNPDAMPGMIALGQGAAMQQQINFTRMEEHEADRVGIGYLAAAGFDPNGMASFFSKMMRDRGLSGTDIPSLLLTHPVDSVRVAEARARITSMAPAERRPDSETYDFVRERVRVLTAANPAELRRYYERERAARPDDDALRYGAALVELGTGNAHAALTLLKQVAAHKPHLPLVHAALGRTQLAAGFRQAGLATFEQGLKLSPRNVPLTVRYAEALMATEQAKKAHAVLLDLFNNVAPTPEQIRLIATAANAAGDTGDAYSYMAEYHLAHGDLDLANLQLDLAQSTPGLTEVQRKRFRARQDEIIEAQRRPRRASTSSGSERGEEGGGRDGGRSPRNP
jgi:predicted Zn-dependent protease